VTTDHPGAKARRDTANSRPARSALRALEPCDHHGGWRNPWVKGLGHRDGRSTPFGGVRSGLFRSLAYGVLADAE